MNLLPDEEVLLTSSGGTLVLTSHRLRHDVQGASSSHTVSIMLEELASCAVARSSSVLFLILAGLCVVLGIAVAAVGNSRDSEGAIIAGVVAAIVFVGIYFASRQQVLAFASAGATIRINAIGMDREIVKAFIENAEAAKNKRYQNARGAV